VLRLLPRSLGAAVAVLAAVVAVLWFTPSDHYLYLPDPARPVDPIVRVPNEKEDAGEGGIYFLEVGIRKASVFERIFPGIYKGSTLVPEKQYNPRGLSFEARRTAGRRQMSLSQRIAVSVALRKLGYTVEGGVEVVKIRPESAAAGKLKPGDVIVQATGQKVETVEDLAQAFEPITPGDEVELAVRRSGGRREFVLETRAAEDDPHRAVIGIEIQQAVGTKFPVDVRIDAGSVIGPSAGLAFALDVFDELGEDVDGGRRIAVTGELGLDGGVTPIGGVKQKTIGAEDAGAEILVVPKQNAAEAREYADEIEVVAVSTFDEALSLLATQ
jgi:Lon-like protease